MNKALLIVALTLVSSGFLISQDSVQHSRNIKSAGILIGSGIIGIDYEYRVNDTFGVQGGVGLLGFDASLNLHFSNTVEGGYISLAYKSIGFGVLNTLGPEYGSRWMFGDAKDWGIVVRIGVGKVVAVDSKYERDFINDHNITKFPDAVLTYSFGICF